MQAGIRTGERHAGIDALRILAMFFAALLHVLMQGGVLDNVPWMSGQYAAAWLWEIIAYCAVDCFALISGYVGVQAEFRWSRLLGLWLQVVFFTLTITLAFAVLMPGAVTAKEWIAAVFPITSNQYWYVTDYAGVLLLMPFLNLILARAGRRQLGVFFLVGLLLFCALPSLLDHSPYTLSKGNSALWLSILYLAGGYFRLYGLPGRVSRKTAVLVFLASTAAAWLSKLLVELLVFRASGRILAFTRFVTYTSPMIVINAAALLCFFARTDIRSRMGRRLVRLFAPTVLGVYVIHVHPLVWEHLLPDFARFIATYSPLGLTAAALALALLLCLVCSVIELLRLRLFRLLRVSDLYGRFDAFLLRSFSRLPDE